jgi:hypothetical protein
MQKYKNREKGRKCSSVDECTLKRGGGRIKSENPKRI